jgi:hypothetical protein
MCAIEQTVAGTTRSLPLYWIAVPPGVLHPVADRRPAQRRHDVLIIQLLAHHQRHPPCPRPLVPMVSVASVAVGAGVGGSSERGFQ